MRVCLLYGDSDRPGDGAYPDEEDLIRDLGLKALFRASARQLIGENGRVDKVDKGDPFLSDTLRKVMMVPLASPEEIAYRQGILRDCLRQEALVRGLYRISTETLKEWTALGRGPGERTQETGPVTRLIGEIRVLHLFCDALREIRDLFDEKDAAGEPRHAHLASGGMIGFYRRFCAAFSPEKERAVRGVLEDISFFADAAPDGGGRATRPRIVLECGLEDGLKFSSLRLAAVSSERAHAYRPGSTMRKLQEIRHAMMPDSFSTEKDPRISEQTRLLEFGVVSCLTDRLRSEVTDEFRAFFDQLHFQSAFYLGAVQLMAQMDRFGLECCFPEAAEGAMPSFLDLKECVMALEQRLRVVGNSCDMTEKDILIVTGANQGGKSTFLRSIGIAQVMLQCGLPVTARAFRSGIYPRLFVHFTRREDTAMNSGRLDEELGRMDRIVDRIGEGSMLLLNESFATTTEEEGSDIAWGIVRALGEAGVKILTVTHLLPFAKRAYDEAQAGRFPRAGFLSAERMPDGRRTYRMIPRPPQMTSFGLDLYEEIVEHKQSALMK